MNLSMPIIQKTCEQCFNEGVQQTTKLYNLTNYKIPIIVSIFVLIQGFRIYYQRKITGKLERNEITLKRYLNQEYILLFLDMTCYPLAMFLIFITFMMWKNETRKLYQMRKRNYRSIYLHTTREMLFSKMF